MVCWKVLGLLASTATAYKSKPYVVSKHFQKNQEVQSLWRRTRPGKEFKGMWVNGQLIFPPLPQGTSASSFMDGIPPEPSRNYLSPNGSRVEPVSNEYMYRWLFPQANTQSLREVDISQVDAVQAAGPLALLHAMKLCASNDMLTTLNQKVRDAGRLRLHVVGVNTQLEPSMAWKQFLIGPLSVKDAELVEASGVEATPFKGVHLSVLFNGYGHASDLERRTSLASAEYSETFAHGVYHNVVTEVPDLVLAINPGFASEPTLWWPTLNKLQHASVPVIATGYGAHDMEITVYKRNEISSLDLQKQTSQQSDADPVQLSDMCLRSDLEDMDLHPVVGDRRGNVFLARQLGFTTSLLSANPFVYCDYPQNSDCNSNAEVFLLKPVLQSQVGLEKGREKLPLSIFHDLLLDHLREELENKFIPCAERLVNDITVFSSHHISIAGDSIKRKCLEKDASHMTSNTETLISIQEHDMQHGLRRRRATFLATGSPK